MNDRQIARDTSARYWPTVLVLMGVVIRLVGVSRPILGNMANKASFCLMMARNFLDPDHGWISNLFNPRLDILRGGIESYHMFNFPIVELAVAVFYRIFGVSIGFWGRFQAVVFSALAMIFLYSLAKRIFDKKVALYSLACFAFSPMFIIYGQSFQTDAAIICCTVGVLCFFAKWLDDGGFISFILAALCGAMGVALKIPTLYIGLPMLFLAYEKFGLRLFLKWRMWLFALLLLAPPMLWYYHCYRIEVGMGPHVYDGWYTNLVQGDKNVLMEKRFVLTVFSRVVGLCMTPIGFSLALLGAFVRPVTRRQWMPLVWLCAVAIYILMIPEKIVQIDYYLLPLVPVGAVFAGRGINLIVSSGMLDRMYLNRIPGKIVVVAIVLVVVLRYAVSPAFVTPEYDKSVIGTAKAVQRVTEPSDIIIASHGSSPILFYYCNRKGWNFTIDRSKSDWDWSEKEKAAKKLEKDPIIAFDKLVEQGAQYFAVSHKSDLLSQKPFADYIQSKYPVAEESDGHVIYDLRTELEQAE